MFRHSLQDVLSIFSSTFYVYIYIYMCVCSCHVPQFLAMIPIHYPISFAFVLVFFFRLVLLYLILRLYDVLEWLLIMVFIITIVTLKKDRRVKPYLC